MATTQKIEIPISLSAQIENLKDIRQTLIATLNSAGKDSSLAKTLTKDLSKINQMLGQVEDFALSPTIDESGLKQLQKILDNFYKQAQSSFSNADFANFEAIASESDIARLKALTAEAAKYRRELETLQKSGSSERTDAYLLRTGKQDLLGRAQSQKGFDSTASLGKNALAMERAAESYQRSADAMQSAIDKLESEANAAVANAQQAAQQVNTLEQQSKVLAADTQAAKFHHAAGRFKTAIVANRGVENPTIGSVERGLRSALESVQANGKIATDARNAVGDWIKHLFPQLPTSDIANMVGQDINTLLSNLMEQIFGSGYLDTDIVYSPEHSAILSRAQDYSRSEINRIAGVHSTANVLDLTARSQQVNADLRKAKQSYTAFNNEADSKVTSWSEMVDQQEGLIAAAQASAQLSQELYTLAEAAQKAAIASKEAQIQQNAEAQQDLKEGALRSTRQLAQQGKTAARQYQADDESFIGEANENLKGAKIDANEAEQFTNNLKQSVAHWMSAQQVVNLVKDGIRQAYQDIQGLDAAMTNIAVVTDMSVSDLWSKINEYMSIAQQYGVTTQGVYEVSQLYYQQGLTTNEVMAATTETLKMARIAGMGYAEAADAMTVAIRSFKMEMSDAGHVTDVYSKVAAVTASDTEELAIAMSKTASSAESVGSSFENTTAMLAVMIETTRESAQNLGSALKSIISRYGEMKSGMTQDSEGEIIDYNKTDAALRSVGISIKDAQGQFRDFDDVIFELSAKWDSLDKNTQRYIATIMAGNRQQSRFIALVDNWERLEEVTGAAQDSEDAGLLQYAKTLDSLESKLNTLKNSFQQFYMSAINGDVIKQGVDFLNNIITSLSRMGPLLSGISLLKLISQIKLVGQLLINTFSKGITQVKNANKQWQDSFTGGWTTVGERIATALGNAILAKAPSIGNEFVQRAEQGVNNEVDANGKENKSQPSKDNSPKQSASVPPKKHLLYMDAGFDNSTEQGRMANYVNAVTTANTIIANPDQYSQAAREWAATVQSTSQEWATACTLANTEEKAAAQQEVLQKVAAADEAAAKTIAASNEAHNDIVSAGRKFSTKVQDERTIGEKYDSFVNKKGVRTAGTIAMTVGTLAQTAALGMDTSTMAGYDAQGWVKGAGGIASAAGQFLTGNWVGGVVTALTTVADVWNHVANRAQVELENAEKAAEEANIKRANKKETARELEATISNLKKLQEARYQSEEAEAAFIEASNAAAEKFPQLVSGYTATGDAIVDVIGKVEIAEYALIQARKEAADAALEAAQKEYTRAITQEGQDTTESDDLIANVDKVFKGAKNNSPSGKGFENDPFASLVFTGGSAWAQEFFKNSDEVYQALGINEQLKGEIATWNKVDQLMFYADALSKAPLENFFSLLEGYYDELGDDSWGTYDSEQKLAEATWLRDTVLGGSLQSALWNNGHLIADGESYTTFSAKHGLTLREAAASKKVSDVALRNLGMQHMNNYLTNIDPYMEGQWRDISGVESLIYGQLVTDPNIVLDSGDFTDKGAFASAEVEANFKRRIVSFTDELNKLLPSQIEQINNLQELAARGAISVSEYQEQLELILGTDNEIVAALVQELKVSDVNRRIPVLRDLGQKITIGQDVIDKDFETGTAIYDTNSQGIFSYDEWLSKWNLENNATNERIYATRASEIYSEAAKNSDDLGKFLLTSSIEQLQSYQALINEQNDIIKNSSQDSAANRAATERKTLINSIYSELAKEDGIFAGLTDAQINEFLTAFSADNIGTSEWASNVSTIATKYGIDLSTIIGTSAADWAKYIYENYTTQIASLIESSQADIKALTELNTQQTKGFALNEAQTLLKQVQAIDPSLTWDKVFDINEQGVITLLDFNNTVSLLYNNSLDNLRIQTAKNNKILEQLQAKDDIPFLTNAMPTLSDYTNKIGGSFQNIDQVREFEKILNTFFNGDLQLGIDEINGLISGIANGTIQTTEDLINYYQKLGKTITLGTERDSALQKLEAYKSESYATAEAAYTEAKSIAELLNTAFGLELDSDQLENLTTQIQTGAINSVNSLISFYQGINDQLGLANETLLKQARQMFASNAFSNWIDRKGFVSNNELKELANKAEGTYSDFESLWIEAIPTQAAQIMEALPTYQIGDMYTDLTTGIQRKLEAGDEALYKTKSFDDWNDQDYQAYYDAQELLLQQHGVTFDAFGNFIITDYKRYAEYIASMKGVSLNSEAYKAIENNARMAQFEVQEAAVKNIQTGLEGLYVAAIESQELNWDDVSGIIEAAGLDTAAQTRILNAYELAKEQGVAGYIEFIEFLTEEIQNSTYASGIDVAALQAAKIDAQRALIDNLISSIEKAVEGTLGAAEMLDLGKALGIDNIQNYMINTATGYQATTEGMYLLGTKMVEQYGNAYDAAKQMYDLFVGEDKMFSGYKELEDEATRLREEATKLEGVDEQRAAVLRQQADLLDHMARVSRSMADDATFDFMNQDVTDGMGDTWDTFVSNVNNATNALQALASGEAISVREFQNMMSFIGSQLGPDNALNSIAGGATNAKDALIALYNEGGAASQYLTSLGYDATSLSKLETAADIYTLFTNTIVAQSGRLDKVDAEVLLEFGIDAAAMADGMSESLETVADSQIEFLKNIRQVLVAMKAIEEIGEISLGTFTLNDGATAEITFSNYKFYLDKMSTETKQALSDAFANQFTEVWKIENDLFTALFGEELDITNIADQAIIDQFLALSDMTGEQWQQFALSYPELVQEGQIDWNAVAELIKRGFNPLDFMPSVDAATVTQARSNLQKAIASAAEDATDDLELHLKYDKETLQFIVPENGNAERAIAEVEKYYSEAGASIEATVENGIVNIHYINPQIKAIVDNLGKDENTDIEFNAATGYAIKTEVDAEKSFTYRIDPNNGVITDKDGNPFKPEDIPDAIREKWQSEGYEEVPTEIEGGETAVSYQMKIQTNEEGNPLDDIQATLNLIYGMFSSGQVLSLSFDSTSAEATQTVLDAILAAWDTLIKLDGSTVTLNVNQGGNADPQAPAGAEDANQAEGGVAVPLTIDKANFISQLTTLYTSITNNTDGIEPPVIKVIAEWQDGSPANLEAAIKAQTFIQDVQLNYTNKDGYKQTGLVQNVRLNFIPGPLGAIAKGNVALAHGNVSNLLAGAALAQGTLMGELGPELYVQGGQYYIAGANGPEFVDLDKDAIVFNHLQTASLLGKGHATTTGSPVTSERRAVGAYATGNVSGPAMAGGIDSAIKAIDSAISMWQNILNATATDLVGGGGGGGGGGENSVKAVTEELVKWYNLSRQIEKLEQDINNILAERENIVDGGEYLRSLREQQKLLAQQAATQRTLLAYQEEQLERQKQHILNNQIWSQFLTFDESGNLQYIIGNESNGGQGQLNVLDQLNKMSGEEQLDYIKNTLGYSYTDQDGNELDGQDLITKFFEELQSQIDSYDALFDTVNSTEEKLQEIQSTINEIDQEIEQNQMDLEQAIYDILVEAWEKQIEQMEEQMELVREANEAYIENLNKALSDERDMYSQNEAIADRESLQNRLALLRRSGGSASEIYDLEQQLDDMLKDEYFNKQEEMIEHIEEANEEQIRKLEEQIKLEEEALEYQKENGVLWTQVYEIMRGTEESILAFMQGNSPEFFSQSTLQQKQMLTEWAKQIGIYTEDQQYKNYQREAEDTHWDSNSWRANISEGGVGPELAAIFDGLDADQQGTLKNLFTSTYANEMLESGDENAALTAAIEALKAQLRSIQSQQEDDNDSGGNAGGNDAGGVVEQQTPSPEPKPLRYRVDYSGHLTHASTSETKKVSGYGVGDSASEARQAAEYQAKQKVTGPWWWQVPPVYSAPKAFAEGGLVDYTGPAIVHGSPSKPEAFLNAEQTAMISEAVRAVGDGGALNGIKATLAALNSTIKGIVNNDNSLTSSFTVAPGAVTIQVAQLSDSYDVEELSKDVMNRMVAIAQRATNRGVNRR